MKEKTLSLLLALLLCLSCALPASAAGGSRFTDVPDSAWYAEAVNALADGGVLKGRGNGTFAPNELVTLAELSVVLMRLYGLGNSIANEDHWAGQAMQWIGLGYETSGFGLAYTYANDPAYRGDAVSALGSLAYADLISKYVKAHPDLEWEDAKAVVDAYAASYDLRGISDRDAYYALGSTWSDAWGYHYEGNGHFFCPDNIDQAYQFGVISGIDKNHTCNATGTLTRAELAQMCYNMGWTTSGCLRYILF